MLCLPYHVRRQTDVWPQLDASDCPSQSRFKDKPGGVVVDYLGIGSELKKALKLYTDAKGKGQPTLKSEEALTI